MKSGNKNAESREFPPPIHPRMKRRSPVQHPLSNSPERQRLFVKKSLKHPKASSNSLSSKLIASSGKSIQANILCDGVPWSLRRIRLLQHEKEQRRCERRLSVELQNNFTLFEMASTLFLPRAFPLTLMPCLESFR